MTDDQGKEKEKGKKVWRIFLDGACSNNHVKGGDRKAGYGIYIEPQEAAETDSVALECVTDHIPPSDSLGPWQAAFSLQEPPQVTSNRGELMSLIRILELLLAGRLSSMVAEEDELHFIMDSTYVVKAVNEWLPGWRRRGYCKADGSPVLNNDLVRRLDNILEHLRDDGRRFQVTWMRAHQDAPENVAKTSLEFRNWFGNNRVDLLARQGAGQ